MSIKLRKSSLIRRMVFNQFNEEYDPNIENFFCKSISFHDESIALEIFDPHNSEELPSFRDLDIRRGNVFILVYAIDDSSTFDNLNEIGEQIYRIKNSRDIILLVIGNKLDLGNLIKF